LTSERELQSVDVLPQMLDQRLTVVTAAHVLEKATHRVQPLLQAFRTDGAAARAEPNLSLP
jgi:hypothetical protein